MRKLVFLSTIAVVLTIGSAANAQCRFRGAPVPCPGPGQVRGFMDDAGRIINGGTAMYYGYQGYRMIPPVPPGCCLGRQTTPYMVNRGQHYYYRGY